MLKVTLPTTVDKQCIRQAIVRTALAVCEILILMQNSDSTSYATLNHQKLLTNMWKNYIILVINRKKADVKPLPN